MRDLSSFEKSINGSPAADKLRRAADTPAGQQVLAGLDSAAVERAAKSGDMDALKKILSGVLATPEGQALAAQVRKSLGK